MVSDAVYRDPSRSVEDRVGDLLSRMTLEEKAAQTAAPFGSAVDVHTPPEAGWGTVVASLSTLDLPPREAAKRGNELQRKHVEGTRLGIPVLIAEEALVGLKVRDATTFPDAIAQAATWEPEIVEQMGRTIGRQMVALGVRQALSPLADVARDPRWGRVEETYGEDPYLVGNMATAFVRGLQNAVGGVPVIATLKHFLGYSASEGGRNTEPAHLGPREVREIHALPFEMAIRAGGASAVMPSYNDIDGVPVTGSGQYLGKLLREDLGFDGHVISDLGAVNQLYTKHGTAEGTPAALAQALRAGVDADLDNRVSAAQVAEAIRSGLLSEADLDRAVAAVLRAKFRLGLFDTPYADLDLVPETLDAPGERALARTIAEKSVILLKNDPVDGTNLLPLSPDVGTIAVIGPNADRALGQLGNYSYQVLDSMVRRFAHAADPLAKPEDVAELAGKTGADDVSLLVESVPVVTFLEGIRARVGRDTAVLFEQGCGIATDDRSGFDAAVRAATAAEVAVVVVGDQAGITAFGTVGEGLDSATCALPGVQRELVEAIVATGTPTVVVLSHGRAFVLDWMADSVPAIVSSFFGGEEAGSAAAAVLFGDVNPAGRLPIALLGSVGAAPVPYWRNQQPFAYVDGSTAAVFPFGHGLSYTSFAYRDLAVEALDVPTDGVVRLAFTVENTGDRDGEEVVQVYGRDVVGRTVRPARVLVAFRRIPLAAGAAARVTVEVPASMFALWDEPDGWVVEPGEVRFVIGSSSTDARLRHAVTLVGDEVRLGGDRALFSTTTVQDAATAVDEFEDATRPPALHGTLVPITADSTVRECLDHPLAGPALLELLGGLDEDALAAAFGVSLTQMVTYSAGRFTQPMLDDLLVKANPRAGAAEA
ncbi:beta-glucosidase family protein [Yinghuangia soli]|uniref:Glycoside hydrolase family 3 C-terminal domain-containing protein n=1 Tax=Yinghuangia soli TaxID=2908204 RepID=A0AA41Q545_9ACTN|nr:glycoside hydrolase family 3 N-terminal domain-containing protein [Yinghuangia soli]MCF2531125.1 glycoside hydrolase family 3 C-terminal domain-containing protein [Yinghuangia soli]